MWASGNTYNQSGTTRKASEQTKNILSLPETQEFVFNIYIYVYIYMSLYLFPFFCSFCLCSVFRCWLSILTLFLQVFFRCCSFACIFVLFLSWFLLLFFMFWCLGIIILLRSPRKRWDACTIWCTPSQSMNLENWGPQVLSICSATGLRAHHWMLRTSFWGRCLSPVGRRQIHLWVRLLFHKHFLTKVVRLSLLAPDPNGLTSQG